MPLFTDSGDAIAEPDGKQCVIDQTGRKQTPLTDHQIDLVYSYYHCYIHDRTEDRIFELDGRPLTPRLKSLSSLRYDLRFVDPDDPEVVANQYRYAYGFKAVLDLQPAPVLTSINRWLDASGIRLPIRFGQPSCNAIFDCDFRLVWRSDRGFAPLQLLGVGLLASAAVSLGLALRAHRRRGRDLAIQV